MFAKPSLRLIFLSLFISSVLFPMERTIKSTSKQYKETVQEEAIIESGSSDEEEDVNKAFIKSFEMHQDKKATKVDEAKQMKGESIEADRFKQEQDFHKRLIQQKKIEAGAQAYYKKITPITSDPTKRTKNPDNGIDHWEIVSVSIDGKEIDPNANDMYIDGDISFTISAADFNPNQPLIIEVKQGERRRNIDFIKSTEEKRPGFPRFENYNAVLDTMRKHNLSLRHCVKLVGTVPVTGEDPCDILIEYRNQCEKQITLKGMAIVSIEEARETKLFFDFLDDENKPVNYFGITTCKQSRVTENNKVLCFKNHKMYECDLYGFFNSPATRKNWVPDESNFYKLYPDDQTQNKTTSFPSFYSNPNNAEKDAKKSVVWVFSEGNNSLYQLYGIPELKDANDYLYCDENSFFVTLPYKATYRECFSNKLIELEYLVQVPKPHSLIHNTVNIDGETTKWPAGIYKRTRNIKDNSSYWKRISAPEKDSVIDEEKKDLINFIDKGGIRINTIWPADALTVQENKEYCEAAQRFFISFSANVHHCNQEIANGLQQWNKITWLSLPKLQLENGLTWNNVLTAVGTMTQLKSLHFRNNHPITNFFGTWTYEGLADPASDYYLAIGACLGKLINLEELHIQGLWAKPHRDLGFGVIYEQNLENLHNVSMEVAVLTGIINHKQQVGVKAIINNICTLPRLENLSIDGIPNHGNSYFSRKSGGQRAPLCLLWFLYDGNYEDASIKQLVVNSTNQLAQIATLKTISIYSPGGNCATYFCEAFRDRLDQSRKAITALQVLNIDHKVLQ